jgi:asparagine synthase (glutamine-hydrolysing)
MSAAIATLVYWDGQPIQAEVMQAANYCVRSRYPDGSWIWVEGSVGLAQADLATLPEDEPGTAYFTESLRLAASCRLDNREELNQQLPIKCRPSSTSDAALILAAYQAWGEDCVVRLIGDFAFIIWDQRQQRLFAARDLYGARSLFYYCDARRLFIATEHTQILQEPTIPAEVDLAQVVEYFTPSFQWSSGWDQGMLQGFHTLPAGSTLTAQEGNLQIRSYWQWRHQGYDKRSERDLLAEYLHWLQMALQGRLRSRTGIGFELSGGLDSTALVCLGAHWLRANGKTFSTFSMLFDETPTVNERERIQGVIDSLAEPPNAHFLSADGLFAPACLSPRWSPNSITSPQILTLTTAHAQLYAMAAQSGHRVLLSGEMGDALNDGYPWFYLDLLQRGQWRAVRQQLRQHWRNARQQTLYKFGFHLLLWLTPLSLLRRGLAQYERYRSVEIPLAELLTSDFHQNVVERDQEIRQTHSRQLPVKSPALRELLDAFRPPMPYLGAPLGQPLERWHPYADRRLLEFSLRLPPELKWEEQQSSYFLAARKHHRRALAGIVPDIVFADNLGVDFGPVLERSMKQRNLQEWVRQNQSVQVIERGYVNAAAFARMLDPRSNTPGEFRVVLCLEAWLRAWQVGGAFHKLIPKRRVYP